MLLKRIEKHFDLESLQEESRKMGTNFVTAGIVGVFINHFVGSNFSTMLWAAISVTFVGIVLLGLGAFKLRGNKK